jgi:hypothetical protein
MKALVLVAAAAGVAAAVAAAAPGPRAVHTSEGTKLAKSSLLHVSDLGSGWTAEKVSGSPTGINFSCQGFAPKQQDLVEIGTATSPNFKASAIGPFVVQKTSVYEDANTVNTLWRRAVKPRLVECVAQSLERLRDRGVQVTINSKDTIPIGAMAQHSAAFRVVATLTTSKQRLKTYYDVIFLASRRAITKLEISQFQKPPPLQSEQALSRIAARRLGAGGPVA